MDENEFKSAYYEVNDRPCAFNKAILTHCAGCSRSQKVLIAEREAVACKSPASHQRCVNLMAVLREKALFALRLTHLQDKLPHGKEIKVQCGSVRGLESALAGGDEAGVVEDINATIERSLQQWQTVEALPYSEVMKYITTYEARPKRR